MNRRDTILALACAFGLMAWLTPAASFGVDWHHDGLMLKPALDVLSGQVLFRDTFTAYGALATYLQVFALWVFPSLLSIKLLTVAAYGVSIFFLYVAWRMFLPTSLTLLACALFGLSIPSRDYGVFLAWSSVYALMFQSVALVGLLRVIRHESPAQSALVVGLGCAATVWCRQPVGLILVGCVVVIGGALVATGWEPKGISKARLAAWFGAGLLAGSLPMLAGIVASGALPAWWYQNYLWPKKWATTGMGAPYWRQYLAAFVSAGQGAVLAALLVAGALPRIMSRFYAGISPRGLAVYYSVLGLAVVWQNQRVIAAISPHAGGWTWLLPIIVLIQAVLSVRQAWGPAEPPRTTEFFLVAAVAGVALGSLVQYYPVPDPWHIVWALGPGYGLAMLVIWRFLGWTPRRLALVLAIGLLPAAFVQANGTWRALTTPAVTLESPRALRGMRVTPEQARQLRLITEAVEWALARNRDIPSVLFGTDGLLLCFTPNLENPTPYVITWPGLADPEEERRRARFIHDRRPLLFVQRPTNYKLDDYLVRGGYVTVLGLPELRLQIAAPRELVAAP